MFRPLVVMVSRNIAGIGGVVGLLAVFVVASTSAAPEPLVVHEWGTFTSLQDENGNAIGGINTDDEPVPGFVHNIAKGLLLPPNEESKGVARCHPDVTLRLETPVMYFYPPEGFHSKLNVRVRFSRGWITQYFPDAKVEADGIDEDGLGDLRFSMGGTAEWEEVSLTDGTDLKGTSSRVWTAPRLDNAATVECKGEEEKFLFYRGVGHEDAPLRVVRSGPEFTITKGKNDIADLWLVDVRSDGTMAFRAIHPFNQAPAFVLKTPTTFAPEDYSGSGVDDLRKSLHKALTDAGLFDNEADALLETWQVSYFKSPGLRLFFLVPEKSIPLSLQIHTLRKDDREPRDTTPINITRVMVGRVELVTPEQRASLKEITTSIKASTTPRARIPITDFDWKRVYPHYMELGRFRNALVLDEQKRNPSPMLSAFIEHFQLQPFVPPDPWSRRRHR